MTSLPPGDIEPVSEPVAKRHRKRRSKKQLSRTTVVFLWIVASAATIGGVGAMTYYSSRPSVPASVMVVAAAQAGVRSRFPQSAVINFSPREWTRVETQAGGKYRVAGWAVVTAPTANVSFTYTAMVSRSGGGWTVESLDMLPQ